MRQHQDRLSAAISRSIGQRFKLTFIIAAIFGIIWLLLFTVGRSDLESTLPPVWVGTLSYIVALIVSFIAVWRFSAPIDDEVYRAQHAIEQEIMRATEEVKVEHTRAKDSITVAERSRHDFLNTMSFELRKPLNAIIGFSTLLYQSQDGRNLPRSKQAYAFDINKAAMHLLTVVNDIMDVSNLSTGSSDLRIERSSIFQIMEECHKLVEIRGTKEGLAFIYDLPADDINICCDRARMKQILLNLYSNAIKFTDPPGTVIVKVRETANKSLQLTVADEGMGIPADDLETVLQRFGKVDSQLYAERNEDGLGLGLTLVQELTKMHEGTFKLESKEDIGTKVTVTIPCNLVPNVDMNEPRAPVKASA